MLQIAGGILIAFFVILVLAFIFNQMTDGSLTK